MKKLIIQEMIHNRRIATKRRIQEDIWNWYIDEYALEYASWDQEGRYMSDEFYREWFITYIKSHPNVVHKYTHPEDHEYILLSLT